MGKLKYNLQAWNRDVFGCIETKKQEIITTIGDLDNMDDNNNLNEDMRIEQMKLLSELKLVDNKQDSILKQKLELDGQNRGIQFKVFPLIDQIERSRIRMKEYKCTMTNVKNQVRLKKWLKSFLRRD